MFRENYNYFNTTAPISIQLRSFHPIQPFWTNINYFSLTAATFQSSCSFLKSCCVISSYLHAFQAKLLRRANCSYFRLSAPVFGAKYNIFQLSAPVGEKTWIISIWLQFKCTYFEPTATISILLHLFRANVTRIETIWFFMFRANFNNFNLTAPFLSGVSYFFCYALPIFRANFTKQWTLSNQLQFFPAVCVHMCVFETSGSLSVSRWLHLFQATHNYFAPKLHCFQFNCSYEASLGAVLLTSLNFSPLPTILHRREKPNKLHRKKFD